MKGKFTWFMAVLLCLMAYAPAQGAIVWDDASLLHQGQTTTLVKTNPISSNGGSFMNILSMNYVPANNVPSGTTGTSTITEDFGGYGQMTLNANSQGEVIGDGFKAQVQTSIAFNDAGGPANHFAANGNAANVSQIVTATLSRKFVNDGDLMTADLTADLQGPLNFNLADGSYEISGNIDLLEFGPGVAGANVYHISLTNDDIEITYDSAEPTKGYATWHKVIEGIELRSVDDYFNYQLNCGLKVEVHVSNFEINPTGFHGYELDGPFLIGDQDPMTLNVGLTYVQSANAVPVPASLLLLLSGISGFTIWRHFGRKV